MIRLDFVGGFRCRPETAITFAVGTFALRAFWEKPMITSSSATRRVFLVASDAALNCLDACVKSKG